MFAFKILHLLDWIKCFAELRKFNEVI